MKWAIVKETNNPRKEPLTNSGFVQIQIAEPARMHLAFWEKYDIIGRNEAWLKKETNGTLQTQGWYLQKIMISETSLAQSVIGG